MKIVIVGAGEVGFHIAKKLSEENHNVVLIDKAAKKIKRITESLDIQALLGGGTSLQLLNSLGEMLRHAVEPSNPTLGLRSCGNDSGCLVAAVGEGGWGGRDGGAEVDRCQR